MSNKEPKIIYLKDYVPPPYLIERIDLRVELGEAHTQVHSRLSFVRNKHAGAGSDLVLDGQQQELLSVRLDGNELGLDQYGLDEQKLTLCGAPPRGELEVVSRIRPQDNSSLEGLYRSGGNFCTQCEAEGFRKITYFPDRPDVMAVYSTTLVADRDRYPVLLSNGNRVAEGLTEDGRHWATWVDPFPKPSYLFALVAGKFDHLENTFITRSDRRVALRIYVEPGHLDQCDHAMRSLERAMAWDEEVFGLECDLDQYNVVAVGDFNMGAMENKGLNIFNTRYVLAQPDTATDMDYQGIESVIGHEYFHNWTGNRVTCRDWFQLSLKEGLTVFRDQEFSAEMGSRSVKRISDVRMLRASQFPQDAGPMAHPVRPQSYIEINNFYTVTVYNKGAEVVRMMRNLLGKMGFRRGMDLYFERHDGQAVTTDDFLKAMEDANQADLRQFRLWYDQAGTPELAVSADYDPDARSYTLKMSQSCPATPGQPKKKPFHIPVAVGLLDGQGNDLPLQLEGEAGTCGTTRVLELRQAEQIFRFVNVPQEPVPSLLRAFSAPVRLRMELSDDQLMFRLGHDADDFNRWEAGQELAVRIILEVMAIRREGRSWRLPESVSNAFGQALGAKELEPALRAEILTLPSELYLAEQLSVVDVDAIHEARNHLRRALAERLVDGWRATYGSCADAGDYRIDARSMGLRRLRNLALDYLMQLDDGQGLELCLRHYRQANNMTDQLTALGLLVNRDCPERELALMEFYHRWHHDPLVVDKWLTLQATSSLPGTLDEVRKLLRHPAFNLRNPNKVRALIGAFCQLNPVRFHRADGGGYGLLVDYVLALNGINPQMAARLLGALTCWRRHDLHRQSLMRAQLERVLAHPDLSPDVYEIVFKSLEKSD